jgi:hypothetical protein
VAPRTVDWALGSHAEAEAEQLLNAQYAISVARKLGACVFLLALLAWATSMIFFTSACDLPQKEHRVMRADFAMRLRWRGSEWCRDGSALRRSEAWS